MSISTRKGDNGETDLLFGKRVPKHHGRIKALGVVDEFNAALGLLRVQIITSETRDIASRAQELLIALMGELATPVGEEGHYAGTHQRQQITTEHVTWLDGWVEKLEREGHFKFRGWVYPGGAGHAGGAYADFARAVCRRAEVSIIELADTDQSLPNEQVVRFLNRLSDVLWLLARWEERAVNTDAST